jgi:putative ABC transport system permease protein
MVGSRAVTPEYMTALGIPVLQGRAFSEADRAGAVPVAIIDRSMAERYWADRDPVGGRIRFPWGGDWITVVGVVEDARDEALSGEREPSYYLPFAQRPSADAALVVATDVPVSALLLRVRDAIAGIDPDVPLSDTRTLEDRIGQAVSAPRFIASLLLCFALVALALGAIGIYGMVSYAVGQRTREFGVRMALGASRGTVERHVVRGSGQLAAAGIVLGLLAALALTRLLRGLLFGITPTDVRTFALVPLVLGGVALLAAWIPARRAARVPPMTVMRGD